MTRPQMGAEKTKGIQLWPDAFCVLARKARINVRGDMSTPPLTVGLWDRA